MKYSTPYKRELNNEEKNLLEFLFSKEKPEWVELVKKLRVIGRCGCGNCPGVFFGIQDNDPIRSEESKIEYFGQDPNGEIIGIAINGTKDFPTELEVFSLDGGSDPELLPLLDSLKPIEK